MIEYFGGPFFYGVIALIVGSAYLRLQYFDLTSGFWVVLSPWLYDGFRRGEVSPTSPWFIVLVAIFLTQILVPGFFAKKISKNTEVYTLLSFFLSLALLAVGSIWLLPSYGSNIGGEASPPLGAVASVAALTICYATALLYLKPFVRLNFLAVESSPQKNTGIFVSVVIALMIIGLMIVGVFLKEIHKGILARAELISVFTVVAVAFVRPNNARSLFLNGIFASFLALMSSFGQRFLSAILESAVYFDSVPLILLFVLVGFMLQHSRDKITVAKVYDLVPMLMRNERLLNVALLVLVPTIAFAFFSYVPAQRPAISETLLFLGFGLITAIIFIIYSVITLSVATLGYLWLIVSLSLVQSLHGPLLSYGAASIWTGVLAISYTYYLKYLRRQTRSHAILFDLVVVFIVSQVLLSVPWLSGSEGYRKLDPTGEFTGSQNLGIALTLTIITAGCAFPLIIQRWNQKRRKALGHRDTFIDMLALQTPNMVTMHGFSPTFLLGVVCVSIVIASAMLAAGHSIRLGGFGHEGYGLMAGLKVLAIAAVGFKSRSFIWPILLAIFLGGISATPLVGNGQQIWAMYSLVGIITMILWLLFMKASPHRRASDES